MSKIKVFAALTMLVFALGAAPAFADNYHGRGRGNGGHFSSGWRHGHVERRLPRGYRTVIIRSRPYYVIHDTYFVREPRGYVVVEPPVPVTVPVVAVPLSIPEPIAIDSYDIYIPNPNGSYTLVTIRKTEKGFVGPQGELYPEHPTVEQLKAMYAKK